jgi:cell division septum initiation protein DivIVA
MPNADESRDDIRPPFAVTVRGYDKRQVDQYVSRLESDAAGLDAERQRALRQIKDMGQHLHQLQAELNEAQQRRPQLDRASFRDVGPFVDQILALAEKQADLITNAAAQRAAEQQTEAEKALAEAREYAEKMRTESTAAHERAEQEAKRVDEQSAKQAEQARGEADALIEAARKQAQKELETARAQTQQEIAQWKDAVDQELAALRTAANEKNVALHAEAQQYTTELRRRADEQSAQHQQQLQVIQKETEARRQALTQLEAELNTAQQQLMQVRQEGAAGKREVAQLEHRYDEVSQSLRGELERLEQARRAAESAERHAKDVRARVQREAERVASLAAAAVMAAAQRGAETGEYPQVMANVGGLLTAGSGAHPLVVEAPGILTADVDAIANADRGVANGDRGRRSADRAPADRLFDPPTLDEPMASAPGDTQVEVPVENPNAAGEKAADKEDRPHRETKRHARPETDEHAEPETMPHDKEPLPRRRDADIAIPVQRESQPERVPAEAEPA